MNYKCPKNDFACGGDLLPFSGMITAHFSRGADEVHILPIKYYKCSKCGYKVK